MKNSILIIALTLVFQACTGIWMQVYYHFYFENQSDYNIDIRSGSYLIDSLKWHENPLFTSTIRSKMVYETRDTFSYSYKDRKEAEARKSDLFCLLTRQGYDSIRIYFNKGRSNERYVTYSKREFKPRHLLNPEEYRYEKINKQKANFYYTFTNEDYENAGKHQNALSTPIPTCENIESACGPKICLWY